MTRYWLAAFCCLFSVSTGYHLYQNYQVISVTPSTSKQVLQLRALELRQTCHKLDFWTSATTIGKSVDIMVSPSANEYITIALDNIKASYYVKINDVSEMIESQRRSSDAKVGSIDTGFFQTYKNYDQIELWKDRIIEKYDIVEEITIGYTFENRPMRAVKISTGPAEPEKKEVWFQGGMHAREWISPAVVMYFTNQLLIDYDSGIQDAIDIIENYDIYILFIMNIDGYVYTWEEERLWRKSRMLNEGSSCIGVDQNRNYLYEWGGEGSSPNPCSETYRGPYAGSEPEVKVVTNALNKLTNLKLFIDFHSYSQLTMYPWGYADDAPTIDNEKQVKMIVDEMATSIESVYGTTYTTGNIAETLYAAAGNSVDFAYSDGAEYAYVIELPDKGRYGFLLPEEEIVPTGTETYAGLVTALKNLLVTD